MNARCSQLDYSVTRRILDLLADETKIGLILDENRGCRSS